MRGDETRRDVSDSFSVVKGGGGLFYVSSPFFRFGAFAL